jgi:hypothetical protein
VEKERLDGMTRFQKTGMGYGMIQGIVHWSEFERGGHFAAMEVPDLLTGDIRKFFRRFR